MLLESCALMLSCWAGLSRGQALGPRQDARCAMGVVIGTGLYRIPRWGFNANTGVCELFYYSGCCGNENNFLSEAECLGVCALGPEAGDSVCRLVSVPPSPAQPCSQGEMPCSSGQYCHVGARAETTVCCPGDPWSACDVGLETGEGPEALPRFYFHRESGTCQQFVYRGARGNPNNFLSRADCEAACGRNPCATGAPYAADPGAEPTQCKASLGGGGAGAVRGAGVRRGAVGGPVDGLGRPSGDGGAGPRPHRQPPPLRRDRRAPRPRRRPPVPPPPRPLPTPRRRWRQAMADRQGQEGQGGQGGQDGRQPAQARSGGSSCPSGHWCHVGSPSEAGVCCPGAVAEPCDLPPAEGTGTAALRRFRFDGRVCVDFVYRGMGGNQNNFLTMQDCRRTCLKTYSNPCVGSPAKYPTGAPIFCSMANRDSCPVNFWCHLGATPETTLCCPGATTPCAVPLSPGRGRASLRRFYYNADSRECSQFQYLGIGGNQNNFLSKQECDDKCPDGALASLRRRLRFGY